MITNIKPKSRKAWAIVDRFGGIQLDKIMASRAEAWGLLADEFMWGNEPASLAKLKANGYRCLRVEIRATT